MNVGQVSPRQTRRMVVWPELDDGWLCQLLLVPQGLWLGGGGPGRG